jgi:two-component system LytT family response regulator
MTRVLIVDDEALARERIRTLLASERDVTIVGECSGGREAVAAIVQHRPDLVFLDIQMPDLDGFQVLEAVAMDWMPAVVFVTAYDEYAIQAFDVNAMDYILKPIEPARFQKALGRAVKRGPLDRFVIRAGGKVLFVKPGDIDWIEAAGKLAQVHVGRETHAVRIPLKRLEERLEAHGFVRVHRSAIVNVDRIRELEPWFHGEYVVILKDGTKLTSSAAHSQALHRIVDTAE